MIICEISNIHELYIHLKTHTHTIYDICVHIKRNITHMGNTISRHRSRILIRMYNSGVCMDSIQQRIQEHGETINLFEVERVLSQTMSGYIDLSNIFIPFHKRLKTTDVVEYLHTGKVPMSWNEITMEEVSKSENHVIRLQKEDQMVYNHDENKKQVINSFSSSIPISSTRSILKRHETVIHERIIRSVTFQDGVEKMTIETDKTQCDKIRMECDDEFAVREYTQQEQSEEIEGDMVTFVRATQEFLHLKSKEDEFEYVHSDIPRGEEDDEYDMEDHYESDDDDYNYN